MPRPEFKFEISLGHVLTIIVMLAGLFGFAMRNSSKTAQENFYIQMLTNPFSATAMIAGGGYAATGDVGTAAQLAAGTYVAPRLAAKLITSPKFVDWLSRGVGLIEQNPNRFAAHVGRLATIAGEDDELAEAVNGYLRALTSSLPTGEQPSQTPTSQTVPTQNRVPTAQAMPR